MNPTRSVCFQDAIQGSPLHPRAGGVVSPHSFPELVWAGAVSVLGLRGHCFLKSKRATACWRVGATSTPDSRMAGQAVRVPELPERLRPHTAPLRPCVQIQTQSGHFLGAEQPQASGLPTRDLGFSTLEWRGFHLLGGGQGCHGHGTGERGMFLAVSS